MRLLIRHGLSLLTTNRLLRTKPGACPESESTRRRRARFRGDAVEGELETATPARIVPAGGGSDIDVTKGAAELDGRRLWRASRHAQFCASAELRTAAALPNYVRRER